MQLNSARDVAQWAMTAPPFSKNRSIVTNMTGALSAPMAEMVIALDREGYIRAFWTRDESGWRWCLHRAKKKLTRERAQILVEQAMLDAINRMTM